LLREGVPAPVGAVIVEPVQGRGGVRIPPEGFLGDVSRLAHRYGAVVIADEVFTGVGRCGVPLASGRVGLEPDVVCLGKALGGGFPLSACVAAREVMEAWPESTGEALHTSTFLGHPVACAAALATIGLLEGDLAGEMERTGAALLEGLRAALDGAPGVREVRGLGGMLGVALEAAPGGGRAPGVVAALTALRRGVLVLPAGDDGTVVQLSPPSVLTAEQTRCGVEVVADAIRSGADA
ncbi:MAG: aminotransferase class III-fold pyridoxal phosphate-dependent enzyme, partial [Gemmatimonadota bacterium]